MTSLEIGMAFLIALTILAALSAFVLPGDPLRMTRVLLAVGSAILFQVHVLAEGVRSGHWPLYAAGLVVLVGVAAHWFIGSRGGAEEPDGDGPPT